MDVISILPLFAGIGLFLFGMSMLGVALEKLAGARLEKMLERITSSRFKGVLLGTAVTGVIQSSSATTIMVVGLLNAGIMKLSHAVPVVMGANIGTTVTAQILRLGDIEGSNFFLALLKPSSFGPILIGIGAAMYVFSKKKRTKDVGTILLGLGMIFFGMNTMEKTLSPLKEAVWFTDAILHFKNPILGIILGCAMTAVLQSSSASVGILQALASTGAITFSTAVPIILGQNVGKCVTVVLASFGSKKAAKRAVFIDVLANICGMVIFFIVIYGLNLVIKFSFWDSVMTRGNIADFHTLFNICTTVILLPFVDVLIKTSKKFVKDKGVSVGEQELDLLDDLLLNTPSLAVEQSRKIISAMAKLSFDNFVRAASLLKAFDQNIMDKLNEDEDLMDRFETSLGNYLVKLTARDIGEANNIAVTEMLHSLSDFERISDHAVNIAEVALYNYENGISFSEYALQEFDTMSNAVKEILNMAVEAYDLRQLDKALKVEPLEEIIDSIHFELKDKHIARLVDGKCSVPAGISFLELLTNFERISDHCSNIALYVIQGSEIGTGEINAHKLTDKFHNDPTPEYIFTYNYYKDKYAVSK